MSAEPLPLVLAMTGASGAPYAVRLLQVLCRAGRTVHLTVSTSGGPGPRRGDRSVRRAQPVRPGGVRRPRPRPTSSTITRPTSARGLRADRSGRGAWSVSPCSMSTLASIAHGITGQPRDQGGRRPPQGAPEADPRPSRDAPEPRPYREHGRRHACWRDRPARHARLVPSASARSPTSIDFVVARICDQLGVEVEPVESLGSRRGRSPRKPETQDFTPMRPVPLPNPRTILITGASSGIGAAVARELSKRPAPPGPDGPPRGSARTPSRPSWKRTGLGGPGPPRLAR